MCRYSVLHLTTGKIVSLILFFQFILILITSSQATTFNFRHLTNTEGLSDGVVHDFVQDKYGFVWIGTSYGLNRFDGINIKAYFSEANDPGSIANNFVQSLYCDSKENLWIGTFNSLSRFEYSSECFINYTASKKIMVTDILEDRKGHIWLTTDDGLYRVDEEHLSVVKFTLNDHPDFKKKFQYLLRQFTPAPDGTWYIASTGGIKIFNPITYDYGEIRHDPLNKSSISSDIIVCTSLDSMGNLWATCTYPESLLNKIDLKNNKVTTYDHFIKGDKKWSGNSLLIVFTDRSGRVWITASYSGLSLYNDKEDQFIDYLHDPLIPTSILSNQNICVYQGRDDIIWLGTSGYGLSYFNPDKNFFNTVYPFLNNTFSIIDTWSRAACEDDEGNIWLATSKGIAIYTPQWKLIRFISNEVDKKPVLYSNSVRSLLKDDNGDIWIGTAKGMNRYHPDTGVMDFYTQDDGILLSFFWMMAKDTSGDIWAGSANGLFRYIRDENRFDDLRKDPVLSDYAYKNIQSLFRDSHNRLWIGVLDLGLVIYDMDQKKKKLLTIKDKMISDTRFSSFAEDQDGVIWIGSEDGLTAHDPKTNHSIFYTREDGLSSNRTNNIMVDTLDRVWIGTSNGLCMLDKTRKKVKVFDANDGLLTTQFNEQGAYRTANGLFVYPTYKGFVVFPPEQYVENISNIPVFITSFKVSDKEIAANPEGLQQINLKHNENFFNIELSGLNFMNPFQCTYAYRLDPFDKNWIITNKSEINYTNVPAGDYTFRYKAQTDKPDWNIPEKTIQIAIAGVYYESWWFRLLVLLLIGSVVIGFFRYRIFQRESILLLKNKAQLLEKEKTLVMYENLKQHLNPHFLFNSLTSLSSLIRSDQQMAGNFLDKMSKVYRYILQNRYNETVSLTDELKFVDMYIQLQKTRFVNGLQVQINIDEEYMHRKIVPVTLQNLVENAIKHNVASAESPLYIGFLIDDDYLVVRNNLQRKKFVETSNKQGLASMVSLYHYLHSRPVLITEDTEYFTVKIPLI